MQIMREIATPRNGSKPNSNKFLELLMSQIDCAAGMARKVKKKATAYPFPIYTGSKRLIALQYCDVLCNVPMAYGWWCCSLFPPVTRQSHHLSQKPNGLLSQTGQNLQTTDILHFLDSFAPLKWCSMMFPISSGKNIPHHEYSFMSPDARNAARCRIAPPQDEDEDDNEDDEDEEAGRGRGRGWGC